MPRPDKGLPTRAKVLIGLAVGVCGLCLLGVVGVAIAARGSSDTATATDPTTSAERTTSASASERTTLTSSTSTTDTTATTTTAPTTSSLPAPTVFDGDGDSIVMIDHPMPAFASIAYSGDGNLTVWTLDGDLTQADLLVNHIGAYDGTVAIDLQPGEESKGLQVSASGPWHIELHPIGALIGQPGPINGHGDAVVGYSGSTTPATITHDGTGNFAVKVHGVDSGRTDLAVNEIGPYTGTVRLEGPAVIEVTADGGWTITPG